MKRLHRIKRRIIGSESELFALPVTYNPSCKDTIHADITEWIMQRFSYPKIRLIGNRWICSNQGQYYLDQGHVEAVTPECIGAFQTALYEIAVMRNMCQQVDAMRSIYDDVPFRSIHKSIRDCEYLKGSDRLSYTSSGAHASYLVLSRLSYPMLREFLLPFLMSRWCLIGDGWIQASVQGQMMFQFSQRGEVSKDILTQGYANTTTGLDKPLINSRGFSQDRDIIGEEYWMRLHDISGNHTMSEWQLVLKYGTMDLVLAMIEEPGFLGNPPQFVGQNKYGISQDARRFNEDIEGTCSLPLCGGAKASWLDIQRWYLDEAHRLLKERPDMFTQEREWALELWTRVVYQSTTYWTFQGE